MTQLTLELDTRTSATINDLMYHYGLRTKAELFTKALSILKLAAFVDSTNGELIARKGADETKIRIY